MGSADKQWAIKLLIHFYLSKPWKHALIWDYRDLPDMPGVYSALRQTCNSDAAAQVESFECLYIGSTKSLGRRWREGHHCAIDTLRRGCTHIGYLELDNKYEAEVYESELIKSFDPILNRRAGKSWDSQLNAFEKLKSISLDHVDLRRFIYLNFALNGEWIERDVRKRLGLDWEHE